MARPEIYPWNEWMNRRWHTARLGSEYECSRHSFCQRLYAKARAEGSRVGIRDLGYGAVAFRFLADGERLFDRAPEEDGLLAHNVPRTVGGRPQTHPWIEWTDGEWHLAIEGRDFQCSVIAFKVALKSRATYYGNWVAVTSVPGGPDSLYHRTATAVIFRFVDRREDVSFVGADAALSDKRLSHEA